MQPSRTICSRQLSGKFSINQARGNSGTASRAASSATSENDDNNGRTSAPDHNVFASSATAAPVSRSRPGDGLISMLTTTSFARDQRAIVDNEGIGSPAYSVECQLPA